MVIIGLLLFPMVGPEKAANILITALAVALWLFVIGYSRIEWTRYSEGKALMAAMVALVILCTFLAVYYWTGGIDWFHPIRGLLYLVCILGALNFLFLLKK
ncbi:hypothetical protein [Rhodococcus sp. Chr-9]|uniref:putative phage holin n=1 Tax=Rhodococcus sp. Chr-9 TaxID=713612 RepID=UPI00057462FC|nr:hypothetical protein [Rhodococcus sp. Chr-9]KHJ74646.1 hypothetical protein QR64_00170 [Rhodococcus sp. Chr-9]